MPDLQEGVFHRPGERPSEFFALLFLRAAMNCAAPDVGRALEELWSVYADLKRGIVRDLPGQPVPHGDLTVMLGLGPKAFNIPGARRTLPDVLGPAFRFRSPLPTGGGPLLVGSGLAYANDIQANPATEEIAVQFIGRTQLSVFRAVVETWKALARINVPDQRLLLTAFYTGFQRDDGRSWIDFFDGTSNLHSEQREGVIKIKTAAPDDEWTVSGTTMIFMRAAVDLPAWTALSRGQQEALVGRDKLTGCPLASTITGQPQPAAGCPVAGTANVRESPGDGNARFRETGELDTNDPLLMSHVHRANHHRVPAENEDTLRIFRQGYEFLEPSPAAPGFRLGLNFVSFQDTPRRLTRMLTTQGWLGSANFGGDPAAQPPGAATLLQVRAGGIYLIPPANASGEPYPGSSVFLE